MVNVGGLRMLLYSFAYVVQIFLPLYKDEEYVWGI